MEKLFQEFKKNVFDLKTLKTLLPETNYQEFETFLKTHNKLNENTCSLIASSIKNWALEHSCFHFSHWFFPLSRTSAQKFNSMIGKENNNDIVDFNFASLFKDESDASSFPNGGLRSTFEARGYTFWDVTSPLFIIDNVLYIPTIFLSYNHQALDNKLPLLKSIDLLNDEGTKLMNLLGYEKVKSLKPYIGLEQEFFLIDKEYYLKRKDLFLTNKTLYGNTPLKNQEIINHYFGKFPIRVQNFFEELETELLKLGINIKTKHNEVAPSQFEIATLFEETNLAIDHNILLMSMLEKIALKHNLVCILHEKPFQGINGSGKHNNFSLITNNNINVFDYTKFKNNKLTFMIFITSLMKAIDNYNDLFFLFSSCEGNDYRLGALEAPPSIITLYLGKEIENLFFNKKKKNSQDELDRNRTSPIAFTGNKFEFRILGSSMNASELNLLINLSLKESFAYYNKEINKLKINNKFNDENLQKLVMKNYRKHKRVIYQNDCYSNDYKEFAKTFNLDFHESYFSSIKYLSYKNNKNLFIKNKIFSEIEINSRINIKYQSFFNIRLLEVKTLCDIANKIIIANLQNELKQISLIEEKYLTNALETKIIRIKNSIDEISFLSLLILSEIEDLTYFINNEKQAKQLQERIIPLQEKLRSAIDYSENLITKQYISYPLYDEILSSEYFS